MQKWNMRVPCRTGVDAESERMILRQPEVVRTSFVDERERARRSRVPGVRRNDVQRGLQLCLGPMIHWAPLLPGTSISPNGDIDIAGDTHRRDQVVLPSFSR